MRRAIICSALVLALAAACTAAGGEQRNDEPRNEERRSAEQPKPAASASAYQIPAEEMRGVRVEPDGDRTTITDADGRSHRLAGRFTFDALSTNGRLLYLVEHRPPAGSENYRVRLFNLRTGKLQPQPIADKVNLDTDMTGAPKARATTASGEWVFTLYQGAHHSFVHALNVDQAYAQCLEIPPCSCAGDGAWSLTLSANDTRLLAVAGSREDAATFDLRRELGP